MMTVITLVLNVQKQEMKQIIIAINAGRVSFISMMIRVIATIKVF